VLPGPGTSDTYGYVGSSETVARIANSGGTVTDSIVSATGDRIGVKVGPVVNWLLPDLHGSTGASLSADETAVTNAIRYDAYGMTLKTGRPGTSPDPVGDKAWTYQGRLDISPQGLGTPLYDMGARFYAPGIGGFTQLDTVAGSAQNPLSMNRFLYAQGNPATLIDPDGHTACSAYADYCPTNGSTTKHTVQKSRPQHSYAKKTYGRSGGSESVYERSHGTARLVNNRKISVLPKRVVPSSAQKLAQNRARVADERTRFSTDAHDAAVEAVRNHQAPPAEPDILGAVKGVAGWVSSISGTASLALAVVGAVGTPELWGIPVDGAAAVLGVVSVGTGAVATIGDCATGEPQCGMEAIGTVTGLGGPVAGALKGAGVLIDDSARAIELGASWVNTTLSWVGTIIGQVGH
jgi:RHS repeat-associated protein